METDKEITLLEKWNERLNQFLYKSKEIINKEILINKT